ncbi:unnamed protein product [Miscanthus lutarioriparius]|uniref:Helicase C-terminal domain-containing protein n=1 Tax=Miscanthus lutarioriparius TaxID=422564 RepID=A0A811M7I4_9POAL|nr:unnamed protein product [Miscanthus lutarioriparius]
MGSAGQKRHTSSPGTQSQSNIFLHNKRLRLQFLQQVNELKAGSVTKDFKAIIAKRRELFGIIERLRQVPIKQLYSSPLPKSSDARLDNFGKIGSSYSPDNVIDLDADEDNVEYHTQVNAGNTEAGSTASAVDSGDKDRVKSFGDENSSSNQNGNYIQQNPLLEHPVGHQEIIRPDNCNSSTEPQALVKQVNDGMDNDDVSAEAKKIVLFDSHSTSEQQPLMKLARGNIYTNTENGLKEKGKIGRTIAKHVGSYEVSFEILQNEPQSNEGNHHDNGSPVDELDDLWMGMSVALACSETNQVSLSIVPFESNSEETEDACSHDFLLKDDLGMVCRICGLIQQRIEKIFEHSWKKRNQAYRTYPKKQRNSSDPDATMNALGTILSVAPDTLSMHPQHSEQMKPHQVEGFNFLIKNLADEDNPGGCILAHAPGSGKTFLLISFVHSFLARFLKMQRSRAIMKGILTKVDMSGMAMRSKTISEKVFYELIEENLQKDSKTMRVMIIQNLRKLTENILHYYQGEILKELPGLVDFTVLLNMSSKQEDIIKGLAGLKRFEAHAKCNAVSLHPCLKDVKIVDKKNRNISKRMMDSIVCGIDISDGVKAKFIHNLLSLSEAVGEKVLVFSQYVRSLHFLETLFTKMKGWKPGVNTFLMDGSSTQEQREQAIERFNNSPEAKVFFGSIKACGEGISLFGASRIVILDVHENPTVMRQAIGRAFRPGQSRVVYCYRLVASGSSEEEDHHTAFKKERVSKLWFEWDELCSNEDFELAKVDVSDCKDMFLESPALQADIKSLFKR